MADVRSIGSSVVPAPSRPLPAARAEAIRAAQRAFFDQALAAADTPVRTAAAAPVAPVVAPLRATFDAPPSPQAPLRPGSLLDIKV